MILTKKTILRFLTVLMMIGILASPAFAKIEGSLPNQITWNVGKAFSYNVAQFFSDSAGGALSYSNLTWLWPETQTNWMKSITLSASGVLTGNAPASTDIIDFYLLAFTITDSAGKSVAPSLSIIIADGPAIVINPALWMDPSVFTNVGETLRKTFTVSNSGNQNLIIGTITLGGANASEFRKENDNVSGKTILPGQSATVDIVFVPISAGDKIASVNIPSNASDAQVTVPLYPRAAVAPIPAPVSPYLYLYTEGKKVYASWTQSANAAGYTLFYAFSSDPSQFIGVDMGNTTSLELDLWEGASFYVKVLAYNSAGLSGYSNTEFFYILAPPVLTLTQAGSKVTASWTSVPGATGYTLFYAPYPDPVYIRNFDMGTVASITVDLPNSAFYVAITAYNSKNTSAYSNIGHFITK